MDKTNTSDTIGITVPGAPQSSVNITGSEVIMKTGSTVNISGGGSIFGYQFQAGIQGSADPFTGRYVIVPSGNYSLPASEAAGQSCRSARRSICRALKARRAQKACLPGPTPCFPSSMPICRSHGHYGYGRQRYQKPRPVLARVWIP